VEINIFDAGEMLGRFNLLMRDLLAGQTSRNAFAPWEMELLLDIAGCGLDGGHARRILLRYQKAAVRQFERGRLAPMKLSEYLKRDQPAS
jgi:hypothetical protein